MKFINDICYGKCKHPEQYLDLYLPEKDTFKVFVYIHGGGIQDGDKADPRAVGEYLANYGIAFASINYRMYPQAVYPQFIDDAAEAVGWIYNNINKYGKCECIYIGGSSAGAYISMMLCFDEKYLAPYKIPADMIKGYIHDAGQPTTHFNVLKERGIDGKRVVVDDAAPLYHVGKLLEYPSMMFIVSDRDIRSRFEQTQLVLSTLKHFGYDESKIYYRLMNGTHCSYSNTDKLAEMVYGFIEETEKCNIK